MGDGRYVLIFPVKHVDVDELRAALQRIYMVDETDSTFVTQTMIRLPSKFLGMIPIPINHVALRVVTRNEWAYRHLKGLFGDKMIEG